MPDSILRVSMSSQTKRVVLFSFLLLAVVAFVYYLTAYRAITWWNNAELATAAATLGIAYPPGCLLSVLGGWVVVKLAVCGSTAFALNLYTGLVAAFAALIVYLLAVRIYGRAESALAAPGRASELTALCFGAAAGALTLAFSETFWRYAVQLSPYMFTAFLTVLIVGALVKWWEHAGDSSGPLWLFVAALLFGLDLSVHRTNFLLAPSAVIWILIRRPRAFLVGKTWLYGIGGLICGLAVHLVQIPIAAAKPFISGGSPDTLARLWDYVALKRLGSSWLTIFPRNASFWEVQVADYLKAFSVNFFNLDRPLPGVGLLPGLLGLAGLVAMWRRNIRLTVALLIVFLFSSAGAILYFNIPADFFRSMYRHYLPSFVIFSIWVACGCGSFLKWPVAVKAKNRRLLTFLVGLIIIAVPFHQLARNYARLDGSKQFFVHDYARNYLKSLDEGAILITFGDNDTFPLWYLQAAKDIRPDVAILNINLLNTNEYIHHMREIYPDLPVSLRSGQIDSLRPCVWSDSTISIPVEADPRRFGLPGTTAFPPAVDIVVTPTIEGRYLMVQDQMLMHLFEQNRWRRPVYFSVGGGGRIPGWVEDRLRFEGLVWQMLPVENPGINVDILRRNLFELYSYRGFADSSVRIDGTTRQMAMNYVTAFTRLAQWYFDAGDTVKALETVDEMVRVVPPGRLRPLPAHLEQAIELLPGGDDRP